MHVVQSLVMCSTVAMPVLAGGRFTELTTHVSSGSIVCLENVAASTSAAQFDYTTDDEVDEHVFGLSTCGAVTHLVIVGYRTLVMLELNGTVWVIVQQVNLGNGSYLQSTVYEPPEQPGRDFTVHEALAFVDTRVRNVSAQSAHGSVTR